MDSLIYLVFTDIRHTILLFVPLKKQKQKQKQKQKDNALWKLQEKKSQSAWGGAHGVACGRQVLSEGFFE